MSLSVLPPEVLDLILARVDGNYTCYRQLSLTNKYFREWTVSEALQHWSQLRQEFRNKGYRICETCNRLLSAKAWVYLGPNYQTLETSCINCRIKDVGADFENFGHAVIEYRTRYPHVRICMCCKCDFGAKRSHGVRQKLAKDAIFCEHCAGRISNSAPVTMKTAKTCEAKFLKIRERGAGVTLVNGEAGTETPGEGSSGIKDGVTGTSGELEIETNDETGSVTLLPNYGHQAQLQTQNQAQLQAFPMSLADPSVRVLRSGRRY